MPVEKADLADLRKGDGCSAMLSARLRRQS
jgi:hypothetical protein